jgi:hypothetical protein
MSSFANLKRNSSSLDKLTKAIEAVSQSSENSRDDTRFWQPTVDKSGNGMATIRFLPAPSVDGDDALPWVRSFNHGFQGPGGWFIDNCLTTINDKCPVCEHNSILWNSGIEANKEIVRKQKRKLSYFANILVVSDPSNPENDGQLKLFKFGKKIFDKITEAMNPEFPDEKPMNPFDMWAGANFKLKIRNVEGYRNYDKSEFAAISAIYEDDAKLEELWKKEYSLRELTDKKNFKPFDQLKARLDKVLGLSGSVAIKSSAASATIDSDEVVEQEDFTKSSDTTGTDSDMDYFRKLASQE